jgi:hypothetical protein
MKTLSGELREAAIKIILETLDESHPMAMTEAHLATPLGFAIARANVETVHALMPDLEERGLVKPISSEAAGEVTRWKRTDAARVWLVKNSGQ